jgi:chemotaxis protein methyltransferase CheR
MDLMKQERFAEALRLLSGSPGAGGQPDALLLRAMLLVSTGDLAGAQELCREILQIDDLSAGAHYIMSICREHGGDRKGSIEHSQTAAYLDADFAMAHLQLGRLARRAGDVSAARRELGLALGLLSREDAARIVLFGGGFSREALMEVCRGEIKACGGVA